MLNKYAVTRTGGGEGNGRGMERLRFTKNKFCKITCVPEKSMLNPQNMASIANFLSTVNPIGPGINPPPRKKM